MDRELVYGADPMCSWCYGFAPELEAFLGGDTPPLRLVMGGLWAGPKAQPLDDDLKAYLNDVWTRVGSISSQPFSFDLLERDGWFYDTEPACRAVVTMRTMSPEHEKQFFAMLQYAFYGESRDLTDEYLFAEFLESYPVDVADFMLQFRSQEMRDATRADFAEAKRIGARGFPTLFLRTGDSYTPLTRGYAKRTHIERVYGVLGGA